MHSDLFGELKVEDEVLFSITRKQLDTGLRGFPVGTCVTSVVNPDKGLFYVEHPISELAGWDPYEVIFLLYHGYKGKKEEVEGFSEDLQSRAFLADEAIAAIEKLPSKGSPMALFASAMLIAGIFEGQNAWREDCLNLIAKVPQIAAIVINHHAGWGKTPAPQPELGYMESFVKMLKIPHETHPEFGKVLRLMNILHYDHGGGNLSTFVGKSVASGLEDIYGSMASAILALAGPRHGGACEEALRFAIEVQDQLGSNLSVKALREYLEQKLNRHEVIHGFGHAVLRVEDPRAALLYNYAKKHFSGHPLVETALLLREVAPAILKTRPKVQDPYANVDAATGTLLTAAGFPYPHYYPLLFGLARTVGITIQIVYERVEARGGKGTPIVRPKYLYQSRKAPVVS